jgi:23S rRNA pseudouridine2605 synthase
MRYGPIEAKLDRLQGTNSWLTLGLREGKNREVRKIMDALGLTVNRLIRISFGPFLLGELVPGAVAEVKKRVLADQLGQDEAERLGLVEKKSRTGAAKKDARAAWAVKGPRPARRERPKK